MICLKKWRAVAEGYSSGKMRDFYFKKSALKWLHMYDYYDRVILENKRTGERHIIKDRLKPALFIQNNDGGVDIIYDWFNVEVE